MKANVIKKTALILGLSSVLALSGCGEKENVNTTEEIVQEYPDIEEIREPGGHTVVVYVYNTYRGEYGNELYAEKTFEIPDGYEIYDFESHGFVGGPKIYHGYTTYLLVNNKTVLVSGHYSKEFGEYVFPEPGTVVEDITLSLK